MLAGHSFGGLYVRIFAARYPREVAGMVLIDSTASSTPAKSVVPSAGSSDDLVGRVSTLAGVSAQVGLARLYSQFAVGGLPPRSQDELRATIPEASAVSSTAEEYLRAGASTAEAASLRDLEDKPLVVLTAGVGHDAAWMDDQDETVSLSTNSVHRTVAGAAHEDLVGVEEYAAVTVRAIGDVVSSVRTHQPLP